MSDFIHSIPWASLIDRPPESNAIPLPVSPIGRAGSAALVAELDHPRRANAPLPHADDAAEPALLQLRVGPDPAGQPDLLRHRLRLLRELGRREIQGGGVHQVAGPGLRLGDDLPPLHGVLQGLRVGLGRARIVDLGELATGAVVVRLVSPEAVGAEQHTLHGRLGRPDEHRPRPAGAWSRSSCASRAGRRRARSRACRRRRRPPRVADPHEQDRASPRGPSRRCSEPGGTRRLAAWSRRLAYNAIRSRPLTSLTPGPGSGPSKTGRTSTSTATSFGRSVEGAKVGTVRLLVSPGDRSLPVAGRRVPPGIAGRSRCRSRVGWRAMHAKDLRDLVRFDEEARATRRCSSRRTCGPRWCAWIATRSSARSRTRTRTRSCSS